MAAEARQAIVRQPGLIALFRGEMPVATGDQTQALAGRAGTDSVTVRFARLDASPSSGVSVPFQVSAGSEIVRRRNGATFFVTADGEFLGYTDPFAQISVRPTPSPEE